MNQRTSNAKRVGTYALLTSLAIASVHLTALAQDTQPAPAAKPAPAPAAEAKAVAKPAPEAKIVAKPAPAPAAKPAPAPAAKPAPAPAAKPANKKNVAAQIGDKTLSIAEVDQQIAGQLKSARREFEQKQYELRAQAVERFLSEQALELQVAEKKANDIPKLLEDEVFVKLQDVSDKEVEAFYQENKSRIGDRSADEVKPMIKEYLGQQRREEAVREYVMGLRKRHKGKSFLEPPRVKVEAKGFSRGPADAPITIVEFADYECGFCSRVLGTMDDIMKKYPGKVRIVFRDFPLNFHPNATLAAVAARCAGAQGKFWEMHGRLFDNQSALNRENFTKWAAELKLEEKSFAACLDNPAISAAVQADLEDGSAVGVSGTPAFFINGVSLSGAQPLEAFVPIIDRELSRLAQ